MRHLIEGIFRLTRPLHCASEHARTEVTGKDGRKGPKAITMTMKMPFVTQGRVDQVPFFPANDIRGWLRRFAARSVIDAVTADGSRISRGLYSGLMSGRASGQLDDAPVTVEEAMRQRQNIFMGVFGGGPRLFYSAYRVSDLLPVIGTTVGAGTVPARYADEGNGQWLPTFGGAAQRPLTGRDLIQEYTFVHVDDVYRVTDVSLLLRSLENPVAAVTTWQQDVIANHDARRDGKEATGDEIRKTSIANRLSFEAIAAGTPMYFRLEFEDRLTPAQRGLLFRSICDLVNAQNLGGWTRAGLGTFTVELTYDNGEDRQVFLNREGDRYCLADVAHDDLAACQRALRELTVADLAPFYELNGSNAPPPTPTDATGSSTDSEVTA